MKRTKQVLLALLLTVVPTAVLLAATESYFSPNNPSCTNHPVLGSPWKQCWMYSTSGSTAGDWTMDLNIQSTGFSGCALTLENGGTVTYWAIGLGAISSSRFGACDEDELYNYYKSLGSPVPTRYLRCQSTGAGAPNPSGFSVNFDDNASMCVN